MVFEIAADYVTDDSRCKESGKLESLTCSINNYFLVLRRVVRQS